MVATLSVAACGGSDDDASSTTKAAASPHASANKQGSERQNRGRLLPGYALPKAPGCPDIKGPDFDDRDYPYAAIAIRARGLDCAGAEAFVKLAHAGPCKLGDCQVGGYDCPEADVIGGGLAAMVCHDGDRVVAWTWSGGY